MPWIGIVITHALSSIRNREKETLDKPDRAKCSDEL